MFIIVCVGCSVAISACDVTCVMCGVEEAYLSFVRDGEEIVHHGGHPVRRADGLADGVGLLMGAVVELEGDWADHAHVAQLLPAAVFVASGVDDEGLPADRGLGARELRLGARCSHRLGHHCPTVEGGPDTHLRWSVVGGCHGVEVEHSVVFGDGDRQNEIERCCAGCAGPALGVVFVDALVAGEVGGDGLHVGVAGDAAAGVLLRVLPQRADDGGGRVGCLAEHQARVGVLVRRYSEDVGCRGAFDGCRLRHGALKLEHAWKGGQLASDDDVLGDRGD